MVVMVPLYGWKYSQWPKQARDPLLPMSVFRVLSGDRDPSEGDKSRKWKSKKRTGSKRKLVK